MAAAMDEGLTCPVCFEHFDDPKQISCGHTFCMKCLVQVYFAESRQQLTCPICRQVTLVPEGDVSKLPPNITVKGLVEDVKSATYICMANCEASDQSVAVSYCQTCGTFMCQSCHELHGKWKMNADHDVVCVDNIRAGTVRIKQKCKKHPTDIQDYLCKNCRRSVCFKCRVLVCDKAGHDVIEYVEYIRNVRDNIKHLLQRVESKIKSIVDHSKSLIQQKQKVKDTISACRNEIENTHDEAVAKLAERKSTLLRVCDKHESVLLEKLDKLTEKDNDLVLSVSNARELVGNGVKSLGSGHMMEAHDSLCDRLKDLLKTSDPDFISEATTITGRGEILHFMKNDDSNDLGVLSVHLKAQVKLTNKDSMYGMDVTPDGRMAVGSRFGGIEIFSADGQLQQTVLNDIKVQKMAFLSGGQCVVRYTNNVISLYTPKWEKVDVRFESLSVGEGGFGGLTADSDDHIYIGYRDAKKIQIFTPAGGEAVRVIPCGGYEPRQIFVMIPNKMLVVKTKTNVIRVMDEHGTLHFELIKDEDISVYSAVCRDDTIIVACFNERRDRVSVEQYTSELKYIKTLITDHVIEKTERKWYYLREFMSGELALCTPDRLYIFHKSA